MTLDLRIMLRIRCYLKAYDVVFEIMLNKSHHPLCLFFVQEGLQTQTTKQLFGRRNSSVDPSAATKLRPWVQIPRTPLSIFCELSDVKRTEFNKQMPGSAHIKNKLIPCSLNLKVLFSSFWAIRGLFFVYFRLFNILIFTTNM